MTKSNLLGIIQRNLDRVKVLQILVKELLIEASELNEIMQEMESDE